MTIPLQAGIVYGPVASRRYGKSLGINLLPTDKKICSLDCVYCQYGDSDRTEDYVFPETRAIEEATRAFFSSMKERDEQADWIMISGNGEPTLHPDFSNIVDCLRNLRDEHLPGVPMGILSNAATCHRSAIRDALMRLDARFMKLDAGGFAVFHKINVPLQNRSHVLADIISGLCLLQDIVIQSMFVTGRADNTHPEDLKQWTEAVQYIGPVSVQIYSVSRGTRLEGILPVRKERLDEIAGQLIRETGIPCAVYE